MNGRKYAIDVLKNVEWPELKLPIDPFAIADCYDIKTEAFEETLDCGTYINGTIFYNPRFRNENIRFGIAYGLGQALIYEENTKLFYDLETYRERKKVLTSFALNLLMPEELVYLHLNHATEKYGLKEIAEDTFGVTITTFVKQMKNVGYHF